MRLYACGFGLLYFACAWVGNHLSFEREGVYVSFWVPAGLYVAVLMLVPRKDWPTFLIAAFAGNLLFDLTLETPLWMALCFATGNLLQAVLGVELFRSFSRSQSPLTSVRSFLGFLLLVALLSSIIGATVGAGVLVAGGINPSYFNAWQTWWGSNAMAILLFSPLILAWLNGGSQSARISHPVRMLEAAVLFLGLVVFTWYLLSGTSRISTPFDARLMPFLIWAGLRLGTRGASTAAALLAVFATVLLARGYTGFSPAQMAESALVFNWQIFLTINALVGLVPAIVIDERDRTLAALKQGEMRFRRLTEAAFEGLCVIDKGRLTEVNDQLIAMNGFSREEMIGQPCTQFIAPESRAHVAAAFTAGQESIGEHLLLRRDGSTFHAEARTRLVDAGSRKLRMMAIRDISERKKSEDDIRKMNADLEARVAARTAELSEANRELEAFSYSVSHDLRAPLRHMAGFAEMLKDSAAPLNVEATRHLNRISSAVTRMTAIVEGLLILTHSGRTPLHLAPVALGPLVEDVREHLLLDTTGRHIEWLVDPLPEVNADASLLRQALVNLLHNAVKYTGKKEFARIHIGVSNELAEPGEVVVFIRDNGAGFDMRFVDQLFGICQRLHSSAEFEGTGIGLANVHRIIHRHGGRVWAEAKLGEGATFYFSLKRA